MLKIFSEFRRKLDEVMVKAIHRRVVLYGYGRTGQFLQWYADYYHSIKIDFIVKEDMKARIPYSFSLFPPTVFDFNYKDIRDAVVWIAFNNNEKAKQKLEQLGYKNRESYFDFCEIIYGSDRIWRGKNDEDNRFIQRKTGNRDIQFLEWLEYKYGCNFVTEVDISAYENRLDIVAGYKVTAMREIFSILDKCHCVSNKDSILDIGCGKGGSLLAFLDYGFETVGGVELEEKMYNVLKCNLELLEDKLHEDVQVYCQDAMEMTTELDKYNWFYCFLSDGDFWSMLAEHIADSVRRNARKVTIIVRNPFPYDIFEKNGFILTNQFEIDTRQRAVNIYVNNL